MAKRKSAFINRGSSFYDLAKVVNSKGKLAANFGIGGIEEQKRSLQNDGIEVTDYTVDLKTYRYTE